METKELIDSIIRDLTNDAPISRIMLKAQAIASVLRIDDFSSWVKKEQNGYVKGDDIPDYRKTKCTAKVNLTQGFKIITNYDVPVDAIPDKLAREMLSYIYFSEPISEIEQLSNKADPEGLLKVVAPAYAYAKVGVIFPYANVDMLWKLVNVTAASSVVEKVKSRMLDFFIELDKKQLLGIDFNLLEGKQEVAQVMNQTINAGIYYSGTGDVNLNKSVVCNSISFDKESMISLMQQIRECHEFDGNQDAEDELAAIEQELKKSAPQPKFIKKSLLFLKDVAVNIGANIAAQYITNALGLF